MKSYRSSNWFRQPTYRLHHKRRHFPKGVLAVCAIFASLSVGTLVLWLNVVPVHLASNPIRFWHTQTTDTPELALTVGVPGPRWRIDVPSPSNTTSGYAHQHIITTIFWVGEPAGKSNGGITNTASTWDSHWQLNYGGVDAPSGRSGFLPGGFVPRENPFYIALPYSDLDISGQRKATAGNCSLKNEASKASWCKNAWIAIKKGDRVAYAQWEDAGPFGEDDVAYVFGLALPHNVIDARAGLDVSPAVRDFLGLADVDHTDWQFIAADQVPDGPWKQTVTISLGDNFVN